MERFYLDTNFFLRFVLNDIVDQAQAARKIFQQAESGAIQIVIEAEIVIEIEYILHLRYQKRRLEIAKVLGQLIEMPFCVINQQPAISDALQLYQQTTIDLVDCITFTKAHYNRATVLSFDKDFKKLERLLKQ